MKLNDKYIYHSDNMYRLCVYIAPSVVPNHYQIRYITPGWSTASVHKSNLFGPVICNTLEEARELYPEYFI